MKKVLAILLVVATLVCVAACSDNTDGQTTTTSTTVENTTTTLDNSGETTTAPDNSGETTTAPDGEGETTTTPDGEGETTTTTTTSTTSSSKNETVGINGVDPTDSNNWNKVVNNVFTSSNGGIQLSVPGWATYGLYSISAVPSGYTGKHPTNALCVAVYLAGTDSYDDAATFENKTVADFETVMGTGIQSFQKTTLKGYTCYKAITVDSANGADENGNARPLYHVWVFQTAKAKYFISFMQAPNDQSVLSPYGWTNGDMAPIAAQIMSTIAIYD